MKKLLALATVLIMSLSFLAIAQPMAYAAVDIFEDPCTINKEKSNQSSICVEKEEEKNKGENENSIYGQGGIISQAITILNIIIGAVSVVMIIIGGFKYIISNGDSSNTNSAKNTILYALIGIVIAVSAQTIVVFVLNKL